MMTQDKSETINGGYQNLAQIALARGKLFGLLAFAFFDPTDDLVEQLISGDFVSDLKVNFEDLANRSNITNHSINAFKLLNKYQENLSNNPQELLHKLRIEYTRLFIGPGKMVVPPYETFFSSITKEKTPLLMVSPEAAAVEKAYREAGVAVTTELREPPDHFATECEFMYFICEKEANCWVRGDSQVAKGWRRRQLNFLDLHLARWGGQFCEDVKTESRHIFYQAIAHFAQALIQMEGSDTPGSENKPSFGKPE